MHAVHARERAVDVFYCRHADDAILANRQHPTAAASPRTGRIARINNLHGLYVDADVPTQKAVDKQQPRERQSL